jgi:4-amino-4-deoxy-L-arabinose transferase-like glycosyltransferase
LTDDPKKAETLLDRHANRLALLLLAFFFARLLWTTNVKSVTFDEVLHILHGTSYWQSASLHSVVQNPPLVNAIIGLPIALTLHPNLPPSLDGVSSWLEPSKSFMWDLNDNGLEIIWVGRLAIILLATILGALAYRWSWQLYADRRAALFTLLLYTFDPNILAHSYLATTDVGATFFIFLAAYMIWRYWRLPGQAQSIPYLMAALTVGLALSAKFSGFILLPALLIISLYRVIASRSVRESLPCRVAEVTGWIVIGFVVLLAVYRFDLATFSLDYDQQREHQLTGHSSYFLGEIGKEGWLAYFPVVFAIKTPIPTLALASIGLFLLIRRRHLDWQQLWPLLIIAGVFAAGLMSRVNIGYRYLLPVLPLLYLLLGQLARAGCVRTHLLRWGVATAILGSVVVSLAIHPHYLAYFNQFAGGPDKGWRAVVDSNVDWGQDIQALGAYMANNQIESVNISWLGSAPLDVYGVNGKVIPAWPGTKENPLYDTFYPRLPAPGVYVLSVTQLQGAYLDDPSRFQWFASQEPADKIGYSLFVYDVAAHGKPAVVALSGIGIGAITLADYMQAFKSNDVQLRWFDARTSYLWPGGDRGRLTWAAVGDGHAPQATALKALYPPGREVLPGASEDGLRYGLFHWDRSPIQQLIAGPHAKDRIFTEFFLPNDGTAASLPEEERKLLLPGLAIFDGAFELLAYQLASGNGAQPGQTVQIVSYWRVHTTPRAELKIFLHLLDSEGTLTAQHDGLDVLMNNLQPGDEVAQLHTIFLPETLAPGKYRLQIGLYDAASSERLSVPISDYQVIDRLLLQTLDIRAR